MAPSRAIIPSPHSTVHSNHVTTQCADKQVPHQPPITETKGTWCDRCLCINGTHILNNLQTPAILSETFIYCISAFIIHVNLIAEMSVVSVCADSRSDSVGAGESSRVSGLSVHPADREACVLPPYEQRTAWVLTFQPQHKTPVSGFPQSNPFTAMAPFVPSLNKTWSSH